VAYSQINDLIIFLKKLLCHTVVTVRSDSWLQSEKEAESIRYKLEKMVRIKPYLYRAI